MASEMKGKSGGGRQRTGAAGVEARNKLKEVIEAKIPMAERVDLASEIARGVILHAEDGGGVQVVDLKGVTRSVYVKSPDLKAIEYLEDRVSGKPRQALEWPNEDEAWSFLIVPAQVGARERGKK